MLFPIKSESRVRRLPLITISLIGINVIVFLFTYPMMKEDMRQIKNARDELVQYTYQLYVRHIQDGKLENIQDEFSDLENFKNKIENREIGLTEEEREEWLSRYTAYKNVMNSRLTKKLGYIPGETPILTIITSNFLHGGFLHLFGNMWFLWLVGCNIEDEWGRPFFLGFYILSGIISSIIFSVMAHPQSPLIGASGAIAGVMGAFAVRHYNTKIHLLFIWFLPPIITTFPLYAGIILPFWFLREVIYSFTLSSVSNVAFGSHVGGFGFGAIFVLILKFYGLEKKFLKPLVDSTLNTVDVDFGKAVEARSRGDEERAEELLKVRLENNPGDSESASELIDIYRVKGEKKEAATVARNTLRAMRRNKEENEIIKDFFREEIEESKLLNYLSPYDFYFIADIYRKEDNPDRASRILGNAYKFNRNTDDAPYILLRLIKVLAGSNRKKFLKKAFMEMKKRFPEMEEKARLIIKEEMHG